MQFCKKSDRARILGPAVPPGLNFASVVLIDYFVPEKYNYYYEYEKIDFSQQSKYACSSVFADLRGICEHLPLNSDIYCLLIYKPLTIDLSSVIIF